MRGPGSLNGGRFASGVAMHRSKPLGMTQKVRSDRRSVQTERASPTRKCPESPWPEEAWGRAWTRFVACSRARS